MARDPEYDEKRPPYVARVIDKIENRPGSWNSLRVGVYRVQYDQHGAEVDPQFVGEYVRNYASLYDTFCPFKQGDQWYALYSRDYTSTRLMTLPDCVDIGGEERHAHGFCPTGYVVPVIVYESEASKASYAAAKAANGGKYIKHDIEMIQEYAPWGFISGCVWGDDTSWKVQHLDLSRAAEGILGRSERWGYIELPRRLKLRDAVSSDLWSPDYPYIEIAVAHLFRQATGAHAHREVDIHALTRALTALQAWADLRNLRDPNIGGRRRDLRVEAALYEAADDVHRAVGAPELLAELLNVGQEWIEDRDRIARWEAAGTLTDEGRARMTSQLAYDEKKLDRALRAIRLEGAADADDS